MKTRRKNIRLSVVNKILIFCFLIAVASCEELSDDLSPRDNIVDTWKCQETDSSNGSDSFLVEIESESLNSNGIRIYNFNHLGDNFAVKATVSNNSISIQNQTVEGFTISGSGTINSNYERITLNYSVDDGGGKENYSAVLTKP
jgi:hypothetical protein